MSDRLGAEDHAAPFGQCECGSAWFELAVPDDAEGSEVGAAVCISEDGEITGYAGKLVCIECDRDWDPRLRFRPAKGHLRLVERE